MTIPWKYIVFLKLENTKLSCHMFLGTDHSTFEGEAVSYVFFMKKYNLSPNFIDRN